MIAGPDPILARLKPGAAVVVIRLRSMGDTVLTTPALALLHQARPDLRTFVVIERPWDRLLESNTDVAGIIPFERNRRWRALAAVRRLHAPLCLNLHGGSTSAWLTALAGARWRAGFGHFAFQPVYNVRIPRAQEILGRGAPFGPDAPVHTAEHLASAVFYMGVGQREIPAARLFAGDPPARPPYAVLHLAASHRAKQWPAVRFAELARRLRREQALEPLLLAGPGEGSLLAEMKEFATFDNLSLGEMMTLLKGAELFVGNDSGPAHVAAAFDVPCVVIFGSSNSRVWYPWKTRRQVVENAGGIQAVEVETVRQAVRAVLPARSTLRA